MTNGLAKPFAMHEVRLREVKDEDLPLFFAFQLDAAANRMAAFTARDPTDRQAFEAHWARIRANEAVNIRTILLDGEVVGSIASFERNGVPEVTYWLGQAHWGKGIATRALAAFLRLTKVRPLQARAATDNIASIRVLEKCGFAVTGTGRGFSNSRGQEVEETIFTLLQ